MLRRIRILVWQIVSDWEQRLYPYEEEDSGDYYYTIKNEETGENYMIIEWIKSFDQRIQRLQDEMLYVQSVLRNLKK
jgi:hypothetical protein